MLKWNVCGQGALVSLCLLGLVGCSNNSSTVPVTGTVTYQSQPLADADVAFIPEKGKPATGRTNANGKFSLTTDKEGDGAVAGRHTVTVTKTVETKSASESNPYAEYKSEIPEKYSRPQDSPLTADVEKGKTDFTFELTD